MVLLRDARSVQRASEAPEDTPVREAQSFEAVRVNVPSEAWRGGPVQDGVRRLGARALGAPLWLQGDEYDGEFVMQFDESFLDINLGDSGIMYVFADTAFWQSA